MTGERWRASLSQFVEQLIVSDREEPHTERVLAKMYRQWLMPDAIVDSAWYWSYAAHSVLAVFDHGRDDYYRRTARTWHRGHS
jgi:hypothetical protein